MFPRAAIRNVIGMRKLNAYKNIGWAAGIVLCLLALFVALLISIFTRYSGPKERGGVQLGTAESSGFATGPASQDGIDGGQAAAPLQSGNGQLNAVPESQDGGQSYVDSLTFLVDSSLIGLRDYGILADGTSTTQVWGSIEGNIPADTLDTCSIRYPNDGSVITAAQAAMIAKPSRLVICAGSDGLAQVDKETFIAKYTQLLRDLQSASPDTVIMVCSLPSVVPGYDGVDQLSSYLVGEANDYIRQVCVDTGVYYLDAGSSVRDTSGSLMNEYAGPNGKTLNSAGLNVILSYLRTHTA